LNDTSGRACLPVQDSGATLLADFDTIAFPDRGFTAIRHGKFVVFALSTVHDEY